MVSAVQTLGAVRSEVGASAAKRTGQQVRMLGRSCLPSQLCTATSSPELVLT
jgi:hypothetical protein